MTLKETKRLARESAEERFKQEYPELDFEIGKQKTYNSDKNTKVVTEIKVKKQKITYSDTWEI
jgi:hypothetical protein